MSRTKHGLHGIQLYLIHAQHAWWFSILVECHLTITFQILTTHMCICARKRQWNKDDIETHTLCNESIVMYGVLRSHAFHTWHPKIGASIRIENSMEFNLSQVSHTSNTYFPRIGPTICYPGVLHTYLNIWCAIRHFLVMFRQSKILAGHNGYLAKVVFRPEKIQKSLLLFDYKQVTFRRRLRPIIWAEQGG